MKKLFNFTLLLITLNSFALFFVVGAQTDDQKAELVAPTGHTEFVVRLAFSPDGKTIFSGGGDSTVKIWDAVSGSELKSIVVGAQRGGSFAFSPDAKTFAAVADGQLKLWDAVSGRAIKILSPGAKWASGMAFSPDGKTLAVDSRGSVKLWDVAAGTELKALAGDSSLVTALAFSPDGKTLAASSTKFLKLWNVADGRELKNLPLQNDFDTYVAALAFSPDGRFLVSAGRDKTFAVWNAVSGAKVKDVPAHGKIISAVAFSPDGKIAATASDDKTVRLWDAAAWRELKTIANHPQGISSLAFSPDGKTLATGGAGVVKLTETSSGREFKELSGRATFSLVADLSPDGKSLVIGAADGTIKILDTESAERGIKLLSGHTGRVITVAFTPDGKSLVSQSVDTWEFGRVEGDAPLIGLERMSSKGTIKLWDAASLLPSRDIATKTARENFGALKELIPQFPALEDRNVKTRDGRLRIKIGVNGKVDLIDAQTEKLKASVIIFGATDWAIVTPEGLFDATPEARRLMHYIVGLEPVALEQMKDVYYVPGLLGKIFKGEPLPKVELFSRRDLFPAVEFAPLDGGQKDLKIKLENRGGGIGQVQILVNGKEFLKDARPANFDWNAKQATINVDLRNAPLVGGADNKIEVIAANAAGSLSTRGTARGTKIVKATGDKIKQNVNIYAVIGGISDYTGENLKLNFAAKDAEDFARALDLGAVKMLGDRSKVHIRLLTSNGAKSNVKLGAADARISTATKADFQTAFNDFKGATPDDVFIVYMAGHGISLNLNQNPNQTGGDTYLYLTQEATTTDKSVLAQENSRRAMSVSSEELKDLMKTNGALKQVLILDTCASGRAAESFVAKRDLPADQIRAIERLKDNTGFYILMGSAADAVSYEANQYGQGLLTYSLLQGMKGARLRENQFADIGLLFGYAQENVPVMAKNIGGIQQPRVITPDQSRSFDIGKFTVEEQKQIALSTPKPLVLRPNLRNAAVRFDNLKLSQMMSERLRELSYVQSRGTAQSTLVFVEADQMIDAVLPVGDYTVEGDTLKISVVLVKNNAAQGKEITVTGKLSDPQAAVKQLVEAVMLSLESHRNSN